MAVPREGQIQIILKGVRRTPSSELSRKEASSKGRRDLYIAERRSVEVGFCRSQDSFNLARAISLQQVFDNG
jgi:hypothetical protein